MHSTSDLVPDWLFKRQFRHFYLRFYYLITLVWISREIPRLKVWNVVKIRKDLLEVRIKQVFKLFRRKGECKVVFCLIYFKHNAEKRRLSFVNVMDRVNWVILFIIFLLFCVNILHIPGGMDFNCIWNVWDEHSVQ